MLEIKNLHVEVEEDGNRILNGIDLNTWDPGRDPDIAARFTVDLRDPALFKSQVAQEPLDRSGHIFLS